MGSKNAPDPIDFASVPTTSADLAALDESRLAVRLDPKHYLKFLEEFSKRHPPSREIPPKHEPFSL
jgi:hypothetical protein